MSTGMQAYRASSLFQPSNFARAIREHQLGINGSHHLYGAIMAFPHTKVARSMAVLGFDYIMVDALHTAINTEDLVQLIQMINLSSEGRTCAVVRVPSAQSDLLTHALDAGAAGIIFPHIDTPEQAAEAVQKCRYAYSGGERSLSPCALIAGATDMAPDGSSHLHVADGNIAIIVQIESELALRNADHIAATPGLNAIMLGPGDLRVSLGLPSKKVGKYDDPRFLQAVEQLIAISKRRNMPLMTVAFKVSADTDSWIQNFTLLLTSADIITLTNGHRKDLKEMRAMLGEEHPGGASGHSENGNGISNGKTHGTLDGHLDWIQHKSIGEPSNGTTNGYSHAYRNGATNGH